MVPTNSNDVLGGGVLTVQSIRCDDTISQTELVVQASSTRGSRLSSRQSGAAPAPFRRGGRSRQSGVRGTGVRIRECAGTADFLPLTVMIRRSLTAAVLVHIQEPRTLSGRSALALFRSRRVVVSEGRLRRSHRFQRFRCLRGR